MHYLYMIKNDKNNLYVGISRDPHKRVRMHNSKQGSSYTKNKSEFRIVFLEKYPNLSQARQREVQIKKWRREKKEILIERYNQKLPTKIPTVSFLQ